MKEERTNNSKSKYLSRISMKICLYMCIYRYIYLHTYNFIMNNIYDFHIIYNINIRYSMST